MDSYGLGRWQDRLAGLDGCDTLLTDPPYSARTHSGRRTGGSVVGISYDALVQADVEACVRHWATRVRWWWVVFGDHVTSAWWREELQRAGFYVFAPVAWAKTDPVPRKTADGPTCSVEWITVARTRHVVQEPRSRPGHYTGPQRIPGGSLMPGQKPLWLILALLRDYSLRGQQVVDLYAGVGTVSAACRIAVRRCAATEADQARHQLGAQRLLTLHE